MVKLACKGVGAIVKFVVAEQPSDVVTVTEFSPEAIPVAVDELTGVKLAGKGCQLTV